MTTQILHDNYVESIQQKMMKSMNVTMYNSFIISYVIELNEGM